MDAEDKASAADKDADAAQDALSQAERDRETLIHTDEHIYALSLAMDPLINNDQQRKSRNAVIDAANAACKACPAPTPQRWPTRPIRLWLPGSSCSRTLPTGPVLVLRVQGLIATVEKRASQCVPG
ncbi:hypothetical protein [Streptomyces lydicus]|uniref:hypothetical protein n=1 Tax=Streptomyces lydicus TaxID=47763 RepID=UPI000525EABC|nr:hypothetical protein [Streptomyces lydicus]MDC7341016.1 hypothetical protein [Streptomyces lydicus]UEG89301.1 hypothetical protein LJ741_01360 [Streptomyces lydicus]